MTTHDSISSDMIGCLLSKGTQMPHSCSYSLHRRETRYLRITSSIHAPIRVCSAGIEAAIAMHASPSFCIAVIDDDTGDGADVVVVIDR